MTANEAKIILEILFIVDIEDRVDEFVNCFPEYASMAQKVYGAKIESDVE